MKWKKSTDKPTASGKYFIKDTGMGMGMFEFRTDTGDWYWHPPTDPVGEAYQFEWLDESIPVSIKDEAAKLYTEVEDNPTVSIGHNGLQDLRREAHITCAGMYTGEIETLKAENSKMRQALEPFIVVARHARNFPHPQVPVERLRAEATLAESNAEHLLGAKEYHTICESAFKDQ